MARAGPVTRSRKIEVIPKGILFGKISHGPLPGDDLSIGHDFGPVYGTQKTVSEGHPYQLISKGKPFVEDIGGNFYTTRQYAQWGGRLPQRQISNWRNGVRTNYFGPVLAIPDTDQGRLWAYFPPTLESTHADLDKAGTTAIARCKPTNSVADLSTFLGELMKEGLPSIIGSSLWREKTKSLLGKAAGEFLNVKFGWEPIVADVRKIATAVRTANTVLEQYERDAGKLVRRRYDFPEVRKSETTDFWYDTRPSVFERDLGIVAGLPKGTVRRLREFSQRQWFSGAFTYALPTTGNPAREEMRSFARQADKLLGLSLTPETLWNLSPWSWLVDWVTNGGDVLSNISDWAQHGLVMRYGYIMEHTVVRDTYTFFEETPGTCFPKPGAASISFVTETKVRRRASPFGFGVTWEGFSPLQIAILAAIGISNGSKG